MKTLAVFFPLFFFISGIRPQELCNEESTTNFYTCTSTTMVGLCSNCSEDNVFRLTADTVKFYPYKLEPVTMKANLSSPEDVRNVTVTVNAESTENNQTTYTYVFQNVTKENESASFVFEAEGIFESANISSNLSMSIEYVFTVSVSTEEERYVVVKGIDDEIPVKVETEGDWGRIIVTENTPNHVITELPDDTVTIVSDTIHIYNIQIPQPIKTEEGEYIVAAKEHGPDAQSHTETTSFQIYVHSTLLETAHDEVYGELGENASFVFTATTDLRSWDKVTIEDIHSNGESHNVQFDKPEGDAVNVTYTVTNLTNEDFGVYTFTAIEDAEDFGDTTSSLNMTLFTLSVFSSLRQIDENFVVKVGVGGNLSCQLTGVQGSYPTWVLGGSPVSSNVSEDVYQAPDSSSEQILFIKEDFSTPLDTDFSCVYSSGMKAVGLLINDITVDLTSDGESYTCDVAGTPLPEIEWQMDGEAIDFGSENSDDSASTIRIEDPLCFQDSVLTCVASNDIATEEANLKVNQDNVGLDKDMYLVISVNKKTQGDAKDDCNFRYDSLVRVSDKETEASLTQLADKLGITEFFFGAKKNDTGQWIWDDGTDDPVIYPVLPSDVQSCAVYKKSDQWKVEAAACMKAKSYACQKIAPYLPQNLELTAPRCDGDSLSATWTPDPSTPTQKVERFINEEAEADNTTILSTDIGNISYNDANPESSYIVKVYNVFNPKCSLHPGIQAQATTGLTEPEEPSNAGIENTDAETCRITWEYEGDENLDFFYVDVTETVNQQYDAYNGSFVRSYKVDKEERTLDIEIFPNSVYNANVSSHSCGMNSSIVVASGTCQSGVAAPSALPTPKFVSINSEGVEIIISPAPQRAGPVSCQFVVVKILRPDDDPKSVDEVNEERFLQIKEADQEVNIGDEYFAYATVDLSEPKLFTLGDNEIRSSCVPLPENARRRKREISTNESFTAFNREISPGMDIIYYMVTTTPSEDSTTIFFAESKVSPKIAINQRSDSSPNAAAIVLPILAIIILLVFGVFFYRRWKRTSTKSGSTITFKASGTHDYETL